MTLVFLAVFLSFWPFAPGWGARGLVSKGSIVGSIDALIGVLMVILVVFYFDETS